MKKITIQQAIFLLSTLTEKERVILNMLHSYKVPLLVNGKDVSDPKKTEQMLKEIEELNLVQKDIVTLKTTLAKANIETVVEGYSLNHYLEEVRIKRSHLATLNSLLRAGYTKVENGVGVVQYGILNEDYLKNLVSVLENEVNELSQRIDMLNSNTHLEINLFTEN